MQKNRIVAAHVSLLLCLSACGQSDDFKAKACSSEAISTSSTLQGVRLGFIDPVCNFSVSSSDPVTTRYEITVDESLTGVTSSRLDDGSCDQPGAAGLFWQGRISGASQSYCKCDIGLCAGGATETVSLVASVYPASFKWEPVDWIGPSDFNNPKGPAFEAGGYNLSVRSEGTYDPNNGSGVIPFEVKGEISIIIE